MVLLQNPQNIYGLSYFTCWVNLDSLFDFILLLFLIFMEELTVNAGWTPLTDTWAVKHLNKEANMLILVKQAM